VFANVFSLVALMSFSIYSCGGALLIMMGQQTRSESLFYYFRIEDHIPEDHLLRLVDMPAEGKRGLEPQMEKRRQSTTR